MDDDDELVLARLEKEVADVGEQDVNPVLVVERRLVPDTVLVDLDLADDALAFHDGSDKDVVQNMRAAIYEGG